ncbi:MAG TPA: hypothetical protein VKR59_06220 [Terriglobales bacterium]|nr:hypothetical protein [Terriglobales bacterium]
MKKTLFVLVLLSATGAFAQSFGGIGSLNSQQNIPYVASHPAHASYAPMASEQSVLGTAGVSLAQGERPFSDFPQPAEVSLGAAARELKKQHEPAKKSAIVWVNQ